MSHCLQNNLKLPKAINLEMVKCVKITMNNEETFTVKTDDLVAIQFVKNDNQILVRRGRIKDLVVVNQRELSCKTDNVSRIILDCSEQFTVKIVEIKFSDVIKIGGIDDEFDDYDNRITELCPNHIKDCKEDGCHIPTREHGMHTKEECPRTPISKKGFAITK